MAQRRFPNSNTADEALLFVSKALEADDWRRVRAFKGKASFSTFLSHVTFRLLEDFARSRFGRLHSPEWIKSQGTLWEEVYRLLCLERLAGADVVETLACSQGGKTVRMIVEEAVDLILSRIHDCGSRKGETVLMDLEELDGQLPEETRLHYLSPEDYYIARQRVSILESLRFSLISRDEGSQTDPPHDRIAKMLDSLNSYLNLTSEDRLLLKLVSQDGLKVSIAGRLLGLTADQVHGRLQRLLGKIREAFKKTGLDRELLILLRD